MCLSVPLGVSSCQWFSQLSLKAITIKVFRAYGLRSFWPSALALSFIVPKTSAFRLKSSVMLNKDSNTITPITISYDTFFRHVNELKKLLETWFHGKILSWYTTVWKLLNHSVEKLEILSRQKIFRATNSVVKLLHSEEISLFFHYSDFTWNQIREF